MTKLTHIEKALLAQRESKYVEFKGEFDVSSTGAWVEIVKDIIAMANTGGGCILIGASNGGIPNGFDVSDVLALDPANVTDKIFKYTGVNFSDYELHVAEKDGRRLAAFLVSEADTPIAFTKPGTYEIEPGKQKTAFSKGAVYFRHGAKSEPGNTSDIAKAIERKVDRIRDSWLGGIRKVVHAPAGTEVKIQPAEVRETLDSSANPIRLVDDESAPAYRKIDPDITHPYRQTELVQEVAKRLPSGVTFNAYDATSIWYAHNIETRHDFYHEPKYTSPQYSSLYVDWIIEQYSNDPEFLNKARACHYELKHA